MQTKLLWNNIGVSFLHILRTRYLFLYIQLEKYVEQILVAPWNIFGQEICIHVLAGSKLNTSWLRGLCQESEGKIKFLQTTSVPNACTHVPVDTTQPQITNIGKWQN